MHELTRVNHDLVAEGQLHVRTRLAVKHTRWVASIALSLAPPIQFKHVVRIDWQDVRQLDCACSNCQVHELLDVDFRRGAVIGAESKRLNLINDWAEVAIKFLENILLLRWQEQLLLIIWFQKLINDHGGLLRGKVAQVIWNSEW